MQDYYFSWGSCSPSLRRSCSLHRGVHSDCKFQLPLVPFYDNRNNVSYTSKLLNSFSKALLGFASFRGIVGGKTGGTPDPGKGLRPLHSCFPLITPFSFVIYDAVLSRWNWRFLGLDAPWLRFSPGLQGLYPACSPPNPGVLPGPQQFLLPHSSLWKQKVYRAYSLHDRDGRLDSSRPRSSPEQ